MASLITQLRRRAGVRSLLSAPDTNPKVKKNGKLGIATAVLHLAPGDMSGHEVCPKRSPGCTAACLHYAGSPAYYETKTQARIRKTKLLFADRNLFMNLLALELAAHVRKAEANQLEPAARLNATSDIVWEKKRFTVFPEVAETLGIPKGQTTIINSFPTLTFYDYTAIPGRNPPGHYHLTFSMKEHNVNDVRSELLRGQNVAVVFEGKLPAEFGGYPVIDGDEHDFRPADPAGCIVGLKAKGTFGRKDTSGFVQRKGIIPFLAYAGLEEVA